MKELGNDLSCIYYSFWVEVLTDIVFQTFLWQLRTLANCWGRMCKIQKKLNLTYCKFDESLCLNKELFSRFPYSCSDMSYGNFLNDLFLCLNMVIYITNFVWKMTFSLLIYNFPTFFPSWTNFWSRDNIYDGKSCI